MHPSRMAYVEEAEPEVSQPLRYVSLPQDL